MQILVVGSETHVCNATECIIRGGSLDRALGGASNESGVAENYCYFCFCGLCSFRNFIYETKIIISEYVVPNGFTSTLKQMT